MVFTAGSFTGPLRDNFPYLKSFHVFPVIIIIQSRNSDIINLIILHRAMRMLLVTVLLPYCPSAAPVWTVQDTV